MIEGEKGGFNVAQGGVGDGVVGVQDANKDTQTFSLYHTESNLQFTRRLLQMYLPLFAPCRSILDVGCGPGTFLELLRQQNRERTLLGVDVDAEMVTRTMEKGFDARCMRAQELSADALGQFDGVYAGHIIEHMAGPEMLQFLLACYQLLTPAGVLLIRTPNWEHPYVREVGFWLDVTHVRPYPAQLLERVLTGVGFGIVKSLKEEVGLQDVAAIAVKVPAGAAMDCAP
jgi:2-polyprenyl-3-methyl-5-hydroxy-6-metoxy-1,4-benzoquinol methylase